ncbi:uncharacterized protein [Diabrotica undecimpunctata]|uniref:uncharacterized protein n=1 Tax=Diabrotica undecimpunctata TaxID=50387 RepID=UPI003B64012B
MRRKVNLTSYGFTKSLTLISHVPQKSKAVLLISSMHLLISTDQISGKPEIIAHYNLSKGGVDKLDAKCVQCAVKRRSRRWLLTVFYRIIDIAAVNSHVVYKSLQEKNTERLDYTKELAKQLILPHLQERLKNPRIPKELIYYCIERIPGQKREKEADF